MSSRYVKDGKQVGNNGHHSVGAVEFCTLCGERKKCKAILETPGRIDCYCAECYDEWLEATARVRQEKWLARRTELTFVDEVVPQPDNAIGRLVADSCLVVFHKEPNVYLEGLR